MLLIVCSAEVTELYGCRVLTLVYVPWWVKTWWRACQVTQGHHDHDQQHHVKPYNNKPDVDTLTTHLVTRHNALSLLSVVIVYSSLKTCLSLPHCWCYCSLVISLFMHNRFL